MLSKDTLIKIAVALVVILVVWMILKGRKRKHRRDKRKIIVTPMPQVENYEDEDTDDENVEEEGYAEWQGDEQETFEEMSPVDYKSELLE